MRPGQWKHARIEFEFERKNFGRHRHDATQCDIIVCWKHTWPDMPEHLDVVELRQVVRHMAGSRPVSYSWQRVSKNFRLEAVKKTVFRIFPGTSNLSQHRKLRFYWILDKNFLA